MNSTAESVGVAMLWCPSDGTIDGLRFYEACAGWDGTTVPITYTDYAGMLGTYCPSDGSSPNCGGRCSSKTACTPTWERRCGQDAASLATRPGRR